MGLHMKAVGLGLDHTPLLEPPACGNMHSTRLDWPEAVALTAEFLDGHLHIVSFADRVLVSWSPMAL